MDLKDTVNGMLSSDYKERFIAEYQQLKIRIFKLRELLNKAHGGTLDFELDCPLDLLDSQLIAMLDYSTILEARAKHEQIKIKEE